VIVLGIDPGITGGLALIESGERHRVLLAGDIPTLGEDHKRRVHVLAVLKFIRTHMPDHAIIERAQAMPDQGASSGFNYGRAVGALEACVQGLMIPLTIVETTAWKKAHGLIKPSDVDGKAWSKIVKENSRQRAIMLFPDAPFFQRKLDHGRAEAALIASYGVQLLTQPATVIAPKGRRKPAGTARMKFS
jgi:hypothetical protein